MTEDLKETTRLARQMMVERLAAYWSQQSKPSAIHEHTVEEWYRECPQMAKSIAHIEEPL